MAGKSGDKNNFSNQAVKVFWEKCDMKFRDKDPRQRDSLSISYAESSGGMNFGFIVQEFGNVNKLFFVFEVSISSVLVSRPGEQR